jgi:hypothetical protein
MRVTDLSVILTDRIASRRSSLRRVLAVNGSFGRFQPIRKNEHSHTGVVNAIRTNLSGISRSSVSRSDWPKVPSTARECIALLRKNALFAGSPRCGETAAILSSLTSTCRRHEINPQAYLTQLLANLPDTPVSQLDEWLPDRWQKTHAASNAVTHPGK